MSPPEITLHRCPFMFNKLSGHPCWRVQKALDEAGVAYQVVKQPALRWNRTEIDQRTGQRALPVIELADGTMVREDSRELAERIRGGWLTGAADDR
jgi:hypothetical protein